MNPRIAILPSIFSITLPGKVDDSILFAILSMHPPAINRSFFPEYIGVYISTSFNILIIKSTPYQLLATIMPKSAKVCFQTGTRQGRMQPHLSNKKFLHLNLNAYNRIKNW
jgi:hypothetical protein